MPEKQLPNSKEDAEPGLLGSVILDPEVIVDVAPIVKAADFYGYGHRLIYQAIMELYMRREPIDLITLSDLLEKWPASEGSQARDGLDEVGGGSYITSLINRVPTSGNAKYYARIVAKKATLRRLVHAAGQIAAVAYSEDEEALSKSEEMIMAIGREMKRNDLVGVPEYLPEYMTELEKRSKGISGVRGVSTGIRALDGGTGGLQGGKLYIPAGRPGDGKSTLCQNIAYHATMKQGLKVGYLSLEMSKDDLMDCFMSMHSRKLNSLDLQNGKLDEKQWQMVTDTADDLESMGLYFEYVPGIFFDDLASIARAAVQKHGVNLFVVDYLQLVRYRIDGKRIQMREMEVAEIARAFKALAGELDVPFLVPSQLNRQVEHSAVVEDEQTGLSFKMPQLADLRESGEIEQSADVVLFLARAIQDPTIVRLQVGKNRRGPKFFVDLKFEGETTRFLPLVHMQDIAAD